MRALLVAYNFPPVSGAGVWRTLKLAKFLPEHGVDPAVLTVSNPSVPTLDDSLTERECDPSMEIVRARTFEPGYAMKKAVWAESAEQEKKGLLTRAKGMAISTAKSLLFPDPQVLWLPHAAAKLAGRVASGQDDVVFVTAPPFSQFLMAPLVRMRPGKALVLDYRDEWITYRNTYEMMGRVGALIGGPLERMLLRSAHMVTTATEAFRENLLKEFSFLDPERVVAIPNGYDPDDFPNIRVDPPIDRFVITYAGTVFKLTRPVGFLEALRLLTSSNPKLAKRLEVRFYGRIVETEKKLFEGLEKCGVTTYGYVDKSEVMRAQMQSHLILCSLDEVEGNERIYPGKIFELMHLKRPVLVTAPEGALTELCRKHKLGAVFGPRDVSGIAEFLETKLIEQQAGGYLVDSRAQHTESFHRRELAKRFAEVFEMATNIAKK